MRSVSLEDCFFTPFLLFFIFLVRKKSDGLLFALYHGLFQQSKQKKKKKGFLAQQHNSVYVVVHLTVTIHTIRKMGLCEKIYHYPNILLPICTINK